MVTRASSSPRRSWSLAVLSGAGLVSSVNVSVVNVVLADLSDDLGATTADLQWILNSYLLAYVGLMLAAATWGDRAGRVRSFRIGVAAAAVTSVAAAFAPTPFALILCRAAMGTSMALLVPVSLAIVADLYPEPRERTRAFGVWVGVGSSGLAIGPVIGGALLEHFWWGSVFIVSVPILVAMYFAAKWCLTESRREGATSYDIGGMLLSIAGLSVLVWAVIEAPGHGWLAPEILGGLCLGCALLASFVAWEVRAPHPMLELSYLRSAPVSATLTAFFAVMFSFTGALLIVSLLLRTVRGYGPLATGGALVPMSLGVVVGSIVSARAAELVGAARAVAAGLAFVMMGWAMLGMVGVGSSFAELMAATMLVGFGFGLVNAPLVDVLVATLPAGEASLATALGTEARNLGNVFGVAVLGSLHSSAYRSALGTATSGLGLTTDQVAVATDSIAHALDVAGHVGGHTGSALKEAAFAAFIHGQHVVAVGAIAVSGFALVVTLSVLSRPVGRPSRSVGMQLRTNEQDDG
jgi:MFS family permease